MYKFDPQMKDEISLKNTFIIGKKYLENLISDLKPKKGKLTAQSLLIVGPRGSGKSHFMKMVYHSIKDNEVLKKNYIPISFPEDLYVNTMYHFLRDALYRIFNELNDNAINLDESMNLKIKELRRKFEEINIPIVKSSKSEQRLQRAEQEKQYYIIMREIFLLTQYKMIFLVENLQDLFGNKFSDEELKTLRAFLIEDSSPLIIIGSAVTLFDRVQKYGEAFYNFFKIRRLDGLNDEEVFELLRNEALIRCCQEEEYAKLIERIQLSESQIKLYNIMTSGRPRLILFLYDLLLEKETISVDDILYQITELTPYFKSEMDSLSGTKQMILSAICMGSPAQTVTEIAEEINETIGIVNENIKRLIDDGMVKILDIEPNSEIRKNEKFYIVSDYYFRIWFQVRQSICKEDGIKWISELSVLLFSEKELKEKMVNSKDDNKIIYEKALEFAKSDFYSGILESSNNSNSYSIKINNRIDDLVKNKKWEETLTLLSQEIEKNKYDDIKSLYNVRAAIYQNIREYKNAEKDLIKLLELDPDNSEFLNELGFVYLRQGKYNLSMQVLRKSIELNQHNAYAYNNLGKVYSHIQDYPNSIIAFEKAISLKGDIPEAYAFIARAYYGMKQYSKALEYYGKIVNDEKFSYFALSYSGQCHYYLGEYNKSLNCFEEALKLNVSNKLRKMIYSSLIGILINVKEYERAVEYGEKALKENCLEKKESYYFLGVAYIKLKKYDKAYYYFNLCITLDQNYSKIVVNALMGLKTFAKDIFNERDVLARLMDNKADLNTKIEAAVQLLCLNKFNGIDTLFNEIFGELKISEAREVIERIHLYFMAETILRLNNESKEKDYLICSRYFLYTLSILYSGEDRISEKIMEFIICYAESTKKGKINSEGLKNIVLEWGNINETQVPEIMMVLFDALENPKSRKAQVWGADPLFNKVLKMLNKE